MSIFNFSNTIELKEEIVNDLETFDISANRYPVRFIFLNSHEELRDLVSVLTDTSKKTELSSFLFKENSWLSGDQVIKEIKKYEENVVIVPFSEFIRFTDDEDFNKIFTSLAEIENTDYDNKYRLYIPLVGLWERFNKIFWKNFFKKDHWAPIWKLDTSPKLINIFQINFDFKKGINTNDLELITNSKEWFELWKKEDVNNIISLPKQLSIFFNDYLNDQTFTLENVDTPKEYLSKILEANIDIPFSSDEEEYWDKILIDVSKTNKKNISLENIAIELLNINNLNNLELNDYLDYYIDSINDRYKQWIIKNVFLKSKKYEDSYLYLCFKSTKRLGNNSLFNKIFLEIFNEDFNESHLSERRNLLRNLNKYDLSFSENKFKEHFKKIDKYSYKEQLKYLTNTTRVEKEKIFDIISMGNLNSFSSELKMIFPELYYYLDWNISLDNDMPIWLIDYFKEYNQSKVMNNKSEKLKSLLLENNNPNQFYDWYIDVFESQDIEFGRGDYGIWIDGLGAEWLPLLINSLNKYGKYNNRKVKSKFINSVNLPSSTEFNKRVCDKKISDLDNYIHDNHYKYPNSLLDEIELVDNIAKTISKLDYSKIFIYSDHGFSFLCNKKFGAYKKYDFKKAKHEGRYLLVENGDYQDTEDYLCTETESLGHEGEKYLVTLQHMSLYNTPSHEVHGGATPEEVLVPFIVFERDYDVIEYEIVQSVDEINISKTKELSIKISPEPSSLPIAIYNNEKLEVCKNNSEYIILLNDNFKKGKQNITIKINDEEVEELEINIKKGGMEEVTYDFG